MDTGMQKTKSDELCEWCGNLQSRPCHACRINYDHMNCGEGHPKFQMLPYKYCPMCGRELCL